jgi:predicted TIM-barrel fold metal-dependent hydrolase
MHPETDSSKVRTMFGRNELSDEDRARLAEVPPLISTDSHVMEPESVWDPIPAKYREPVQDIFARMGFKRTGLPQGARDPKARLIDQDQDGIESEVLFPNDGMALFAMDAKDGDAQAAAFRVYNDWIAEFCSVAPGRYFGIPCLSMYDIKGAVKELHRSLDMGLVGGMIWQVPDPALPFNSDHYEPLWAAAAEAGAPIHMHILTGHSYVRFQKTIKGFDRIRHSVNVKTNDTIEQLYAIMFSGVFKRHPKLKIVLAESECGWLPFILQQWDYYYERHSAKDSDTGVDRHPSEIFFDHVFCTWLEDYSGTRQFTWWGQDNLMWSNDYPHPNMTFPYSRENVLGHIGKLPKDVQRKLVRGNAIRLYGLESRLKATAETSTP